MLPRGPFYTNSNIRGESTNLLRIRELHLDYHSTLDTLQKMETHLSGQSAIDQIFENNTYDL